MPERRPLVAANWKMHKTRREARDFLEAFLPRAQATTGVEIVVCPPFLSLPVAAKLCDGTEVGVGAQNMHFEDAGAFTGELSASMLTDANVDAVVLGHSERRQLFSETDEALARKVPAALDAGLLPILCVGESEAQRDAGETAEVLRRQLEVDLADVPVGRLAGVVVAYEPIWAIGTGRTASPEQAQEAIEHVRGLVTERDRAAADAVRIVYGGSMKPGNAGELMAQPDIDGGLVGGASLDPDDLAAICEAAGRQAADGSQRT